MSYALHSQDIRQDVVGDAFRMWNTTITEFRDASRIGTADLRNWNKGMVGDSLRLEAVRQGIVKEIAVMTSSRDLGL